MQQLEDEQERARRLPSRRDVSGGPRSRLSTVGGPSGVAVGQRRSYVEQHDRQDADTNTDCLARAIAHLTELGLPAPQAVMSGQRAGLHPRHALRGAAGPAGRQTHHPAALHTPLERQGRARHPHPPSRMGPRPPLAVLPAAHQGPELIRALLQPQVATQQSRRPATHQPRSQPPQPVHLGARHEDVERRPGA
jgi:hypothetical protein